MEQLFLYKAIICFLVASIAAILVLGGLKSFQNTPPTRNYLSKPWITMAARENDMSDFFPASKLVQFDRSLKESVDPNESEFIRKQIRLKISVENKVIFQLVQI